MKDHLHTTAALILRKGRLVLLKRGPRKLDNSGRPSSGKMRIGPDFAHMVIGTDWGPNAIKQLHLFAGQK